MNAMNANPFHALNAQDETHAQAKMTTEEIPPHEGEPVDIAPPLEHYDEQVYGAWAISQGYADLM